MLAPTLGKNLWPPELKWGNGQHTFAFRKTKRCRQHAFFVLRLKLVNQVPLLRNGEWEIMNDENK